MLAKWEILADRAENRHPDASDRTGANAAGRVDYGVSGSLSPLG